MNNNFNIHRFLQLFKKHTRENFKFYLMSLIVLIGILIILMSYVAYQSEGRLAYSSEIQFNLYMILFLFSGAIFSSTVFSQYGDKKSSTMALIIPCSNLEKFVIGWLYVFVLFPIIYTLAFYAIDLLTIFSIPGKNRNSVHIYNIFTNKDERYMVFPLYLFLASLGIWGAINFKNLHYIKTAALFFVVAMALVFFNSFFLKSFIASSERPAVPFGGLIIHQNQDYYNLNIDSDIGFVLATIFTLTPIFWLSAYFKLKEREI